MKKFWNNLNPVVQAILERMLRGGAVAVAAAYAGGVIDLNGINPDTFTAALGIFISGAVASLLLALGISTATGTGPALNKAESIGEPKHKRNQAGVIAIGVAEACLFVLTLVVVLWWFGVRP